VITEHKIDHSDVIGGDTGTQSGAVATFAGVVRGDDVDGGKRRVAKIFYECYHEMAHKELAAIVEEARAEFDVRSVKVLHRVGEVPAGETSLLVAVYSGHRAAAFAAAAFVVEQIKIRVPIWKKEIYDDETYRWQ
jgi:molybdopterin synthase catalytic subunit